MDNNKLIARFQELTLFPDDRLFEIYQHVTGEVSTNRHQVIRDLAVNAKVTWSYEMNPKDAAMVDGIKELMKCFECIYSKSWNYTHCSWKRDIDRVYEVADDKIILLKNPGNTKKDMTEFAVWWSELLGPEPTRERECSLADEAFIKFKDMFFYEINRSLVDTFTLNIALDACSAIANDPSLQIGNGVSVVGGYCEAVRRYMVSTALDADNGGDYDATNEEHRSKMMEQVSPMLSAFPDSPTPPPEPDDVPGMPDLNTHLGGLPDEADPNEVVIDVEEAVIQTTPLEQVPDQDAHLSLKIVGDGAKVKRKEYRDMIDTYKEIPINKIAPYSWRTCREEHDLTGRCAIFIKRNPGTKKQNMCFKYKEGHICEEGWEGSFATEFGPCSLHPYGEVIVCCD